MKREEIVVGKWYKVVTEREPKVLLEIDGDQQIYWFADSEDGSEDGSNGADEYRLHEIIREIDITYIPDEPEDEPEEVQKPKRSGQDIMDEALLKEATKQMKADKGKAPMNLLPFESLEEVAHVLGFGAEKYEERGWYDNCETIEDFKRYEASLLRHMSSWLQGNEIDEETGFHELAHLTCNALFLLSLKNKHKLAVIDMQEKRRTSGGVV